MRTLFWIRWFLIFKCVNTSQKNFQIIVDDVGAKILNKETIEKLDCQVVQSDNRSIVNCQMLLNREVPKVDIRTALEYKRASGPAMKLYDARLDACLFMGSAHKNRFFNIYSKNFRKFSNLQCPLKANFNYTLEGFYVDEQEFPSSVPSGTFRCLSEFYLNKTLIVSRIIAHGKVTDRL
ncbi:uncharacterized protein LOC108032328 [Drosophila biarmipes]|uniref:uncharacterized protein LOC108032328 n=1 Tax=Drosophila biarmipes TaxID=125945 RepID=UPI0007E899CE|nr:uncharacterized protein LOC108032328 [Drosophila biarmipes]